MANYRGANGYNSDQQSVTSMDDGPNFVVEHLATFTISAQTGLVYPADGMRRLLEMEKTSGIWTQKMQLRLERKWVVIMDLENGDVVEKFPLHLIRDPTAFTSNNPREMYNNIFVFIVGEDAQGQNPAEMHIFQCVRVSAQELVEEMKLYMAGKGRPGTGGPASIPPPPNNPPPDPPHNGMHVREQVNAFNAVAQQREKVAYNRELNDETSSTSSEKYEREVAILNRCFDDIERFIARLQHAAAASRELERRHKSRKSKKKDMGDGMLSMRARPPPEPEFVDIFQKFKLSFILLAKLKAHIHDPNAPELVHFLFTPLALIVDASRDGHGSATPNLPSKVVTPLLTQDAVELLENCLTSKETELWQSLGEPWQIPREKWPGIVAPYNPVFMDGWAPDMSFLNSPTLGSAPGSSRGPSVEKEDLAPPRETNRSRGPPEPRRYPERSSSGYDYDSESSPRRGRKNAMPVREGSRTPPSERGYPWGAGGGASAGSNISDDSIDHLPADPSKFERQQQEWLEELRSRGSKIVQVTYPRTANNNKELTVVRGEYLEVVDDSRKWWKCRNMRRQAAHVPHTIVTPVQGEDDVFSHSDSSPRPTPPASTSDWQRNQRQGPRVERSISSEISEDEDGLPIGRPRRRELDSISVVSVPPPPPPMPSSSPPKSENNTLKRTPSTNMFGTIPRSPSQQDLMYQELKHVLSAFREKPDLKIVKTPEVFIDQQSSSAEVKAWLEAKLFEESVIKRLTNMNGKDIMSLKRNECEVFFGKEEGHRLYSQLEIQRTNSKFTAKSSELKKILERRREAVEKRASDPESAQALPKSNPTVNGNVYGNVSRPNKAPEKEKPASAAKVTAANPVPPPPVPERNKPTVSDNNHHSVTKTKDKSVPKASPAPPPEPPKANSKPNKTNQNASFPKPNWAEGMPDSFDDSEEEGYIPTGTLRDVIRLQRKRMGIIN